MVDVNKLIDQDLIIAENLIVTDKFNVVNVIGNRILQNLFILNEKKLIVIGFLIKEISTNTFLAQQNLVQQNGTVDSDKFDEFKGLAKNCIEEIRLTDFTEQDIVNIWKPYFQFMINSREFFLNRIEFDTYKTDCDFCNSVSINYLNLLINNKNQLLNKNFKFIERVRSELTILSNTTGNKNLLLSYLLVRVIESVYKYALHGNVPDNEIGTLVTKFVKIMHEVTKLIEDENETKLIDFVFSNIGDLMWEYRKYYTLFGELSGALVDELPISPQFVQQIRKPA